ncbi:hypothetical protein [Candidatus Kuenenia stuttgartiensis]|uniref:Strongly similar to chaperone Hsp90, heat shock protein C 62.5 n=1 Tax=Kuenenia stuttgartiensis TaxID=174633 RepID=A0A2C9CEH6_KUEST|nr:hypothetical protein [Candidatus Kuenenia stuttgartiensis]SOH04045.1 strongly similar to chaperone Hsp90, heat shock protein C 62.5 [Candidatus Kuenenia stuttgartiensis]
MVCGEKANQVTALWKEPKKDVTAEQYEEFYKFIANVEEAPLFHLQPPRGAYSVYSILYCPKVNYESVILKKLEHGIQLFAIKSSYRQTARRFCRNT